MYPKYKPKNITVEIKKDWNSPNILKNTFSTASEAQRQTLKLIKDNNSSDESEDLGFIKVRALQIIIANLQPNQFMLFSSEPLSIKLSVN